MIDVSSESGKRQPANKKTGGRQGRKLIREARREGKRARAGAEAVNLCPVLVPGTRRASAA